MSAKIKSPTAHTRSSHKHKPKGVSGHSFEKVYWPYIPLLLLAFFMMSLAARSGLLKPIIKHPTGSVLAYATSLSSQDLLNDTNQARAANNQKPLKLNSQLMKAAQSKANDMALRNYWSHNTPAGNPPWVFVTAAGYQYQKIGENLAAGFSDSQATINGWMASTEHRENMLDSEYTDVGFGYANNPDYSSSGSNSPMTIVVAFYGEPEDAAVAALDKGSSIALASAANDLSSTPPSSTSRAQIALAGMPMADYATIAVGAGLVAAAALWLGRHMFALRRVVVYGESYARTHPLFDIGLGMMILAFFTLSRTAGLIQ
jgi:hypothetical protein